MIAIFQQTVVFLAIAIFSFARRLFLCLHRGWRLSQRFKGCERVCVCVCHYGRLRMCTSSLTFQAFFCLPPAVLDTKGDSIGQTDPVPLMQRSLNPDSVQHHEQKVLLPLSDADVNYTLGKPRNPFDKTKFHVTKWNKCSMLTSENSSWYLPSTFSQQTAPKGCFSVIYFSPSILKFSPIRHSDWYLQNITEAVGLKKQPLPKCLHSVLGQFVRKTETSKK